MKYDTIAIVTYVTKNGGVLLVRSVKGKMETRHPEEGQFGHEFPAICNHCGVMTV